MDSTRLGKQYSPEPALITFEPVYLWRVVNPSSKRRPPNPREATHPPTPSFSCIRLTNCQNFGVFSSLASVSTADRSAFILVADALRITEAVHLFQTSMLRVRKPKFDHSLSFLCGSHLVCRPVHVVNGRCHPEFASVVSRAVGMEVVAARRSDKYRSFLPLGSTLAPITRSDGATPARHEMSLVAASFTPVSWI